MKKAKKSGKAKTQTPYWKLIGKKTSATCTQISEEIEAAYLKTLWALTVSFSNACPKNAYGIIKESTTRIKQLFLQNALYSEQVILTVALTCLFYI